MDIIVEGDFRLLLKDHPSIFAYERNWKEERLLVLCNFSGEEVEINEEKLVNSITNSQILLSNYEAGTSATLRPYEVRVLTK